MATKISPTDTDPSNAPLVDLVQALKGALGSDGPLVPVLLSACEQLGVPQGGTLRDRAARCVAALGCDVPRASAAERGALVGERQILCDYCGADCTDASWLTSGKVDLCTECRYAEANARDPDVSRAAFQKRGKEAPITAQPRPSRPKWKAPGTADDFKGVYCSACVCWFPPFVSLDLLFIGKQSEPGDAGRAATWSPTHVTACHCGVPLPWKQHYQLEMKHGRMRWSAYDEAEGKPGGPTCGGHQHATLLGPNVHLMGPCCLGCAVKLCKKCRPWLA